MHSASCLNRIQRCVFVSMVEIPCDLVLTPVLKTFASCSFHQFRAHLISVSCPITIPRLEGTHTPLVRAVYATQQMFEIPVYFLVLGLKLNK